MCFLRKIKLIIILVTSLWCFVSNVVHAQMENKIKVGEVPAAIKTELNKKYKKYTINSIIKKGNDGNDITFNIEVQKKNKLVKLVYDTKGNLLDKKTSKIFTFDGTEKPGKQTDKNNEFNPPIPNF